MKRKIILHVGMHKTGTTTIQNQLYNVRMKLKELGYIYPDLNNTGANHSVALYSLYSKKPENYHMNVRAERVEKEQIDNFHNGIIASLEEISRDVWHTLILSGEDISVLDEEQLMRLKLDLLDIFPNVDFVIVCALRNPLHYWKSAIVELIKNGVPLNGLKVKLGVNGFYQKLIKKFNTVFGAESLNLYKFEDSIKYNIVDFFIKEFVSNDLDMQFNNVVDNSAICQEVFYLVSEYNNKFPLIVDGHINSERSVNDVSELLLLHGGKCFDVAINLEEDILKDLTFLDGKYSLNWEEVEKGKVNVWSSDFLKDLSVIMPNLEVKLRDVIIEKVRDHAIKLINNDDFKAIEMLLFCNFFRPQGPLIKDTLQKLALRNGVELLEDSGKLIKK